MLFKCKHPFGSLIVMRDETVESLGDDAKRVTYNFCCGRCSEVLKLSFCRFNSPVGIWLRQKELVS